MRLKKSLYALNEAAERLSCTVHDLIHLAARDEIVLLVGIPDGIGFRTYDAHVDLTEMPALLEPQLLALSATQCLKIELNGATKQSDFRVGYLIAPNGDLQRLMPSYGGRTRLDHGWAYWRTHSGPYIKEIDLTPERLFVVGDDVRRMLAIQSPSAPENKPKNQHSNKASDVLLDEVATVRRRGGGQANTSSAGKDTRREFPESADTQTVLVKADIEDRNPVAQVRPVTILRMREVQVRTGLSRSTIYDKLDPKSPRYDSSFPKQVRLSEHSVGWSEFDITAWLISRQPVVK